MRSVSPPSLLSLLGRLELRRGYWTCQCAKGGTHPLDEALSIAGAVRSADAGAVGAGGGHELREGGGWARPAGYDGEAGGARVGRKIAARKESAPALGEAPASASPPP